MKVRGIAMWASVQAPNTKFEPVYQIDLVVDQERANKLKDLGLKIRKTEDGLVCRFKRSVTNKTTGDSNKKPAVVDANNTPFTDLIGNGSEVIVQFSTYEWKNNFGAGVGADLQGVQVVSLVPYGDKKPDGAEFEPVAEEKEEVKKPAKPKVEDFDDDLPDIL